ncbi:hypothetical protein THAOC_19995 [Thalassiosira oceanica]|uniref:Uncharacterized protein n=1 Tax=Thalassiosira oceanica TaxID=159749 RepID=K0S4K3_THAOC|nr:hypothetical protein THAOC_19995 [Thalassiosira oceanica]|eukprot:EJK59744.1 hypothetical protein THAOC_19995 [Thalassiosira oceanica]
MGTGMPAKASFASRSSCQTETEDVRTLRLKGQAMRQDLLRHAETEDAREARLQAERACLAIREAETEDVRTTCLQGQAQRCIKKVQIVSGLEEDTGLKMGSGVAENDEGEQDEDQSRHERLRQRWRGEVGKGWG